MSKPSPQPDAAAHDARAGDQPVLVDDRPPEVMNPADRAAVEAGLADMRAGRLATKAEIDAAYARFGRGKR